MMTTEVIKKLRKLVDENGDCELGVYLSYSKVTRREPDIFYDDKEKDICCGVYG